MGYNIICMKWGDKYGPEYVNRLYSMVSRNITLPHRFVCFTDKADGINPAVETMPLPEIKIPDSPERCWRKLSTFKADFPLQGTCLFLDLDIVIVGSIDDFFKVDGDFVIIKEWNQSTVHGLGNSSIYRFKTGANTDVYDYFANHTEEVCKNHRHEQAFLTSFLVKQGRKISYWPDGWCVSFKKNCMHKFPKSLFMEASLPPKAKIVIFHGYPTPEDAMRGRIRGYKKLFRFLRPTAWIKKYWH